ncbi:uncharacterized protein C2orf50 homolog [Thalassophryne amazonica]|uniref:uncharacterized protein C2orf50 homolog n=1 Tax=Thalassophryne amazonica TaxID=390379 RepID=UPI00147244AB|nr:uncharacterized protein C2orf50 homolog [Thalassophryne amazonica]
MDLSHVRRLPSAGYRSPEPSESSRPVPVPARARSDNTRFNGRRDASKLQSADKTDPVKKDQMWREAVHSELRGGREWPATRLCSLSALPNTANQMFGSSLSTLQGRELMRLEGCHSGP